jgi:hypothetical protein
MSPGVDLGAHADDAGFVQVLEGLLAHVGDVPGDLLLAQLGVPGHDLELLDMHRGEDVVLGHQLLGDQDGVLEVVAAPAHEGHHHVAAQGQLALSSPAGPSAMIWPWSPAARGARWILVGAGVLVGALWNLVRL